MLKQELLKKIRENIKNENVAVYGDVFFGWCKTVAVADTNRRAETYYIKENDLNRPEIELREFLSNKFETPIEKTYVYYEGYVGHVVDGKEHILKFYEGNIGLESITSDILNFVESDKFEKSIEKQAQINQLYSNYKNKEVWKDNNKEYKDNYYISIVKVDECEPWHFDSLFDYIKENYKDACRAIYQFSEVSRAMYISKDELLKIRNLDIPNNFKEDIDNIINKGPSCQLCGNTTYVNTFPYTYDSTGGCVGRLYSCPICLGVHDMNVHPGRSILKDLNGDEKLELMMYARDNMKVLY